MFSRRVIPVLVFLIAVSPAYAQKLKKADKAVIANLQKHVGYLADDKLEGRRAGTAGEMLAMQYISSEFEQIGLLPKGSNGFFQAFDINDGKQVNATTTFFIKGKELERDKEFFPLAFSGNGEVEGQPSLALQEADMPWFLNLKEVLEENKDNPHFDLYDFIKTKVKEVYKKGASTLVLYNTSTIEDKLQFNAKDRSEPAKIPVVYVVPAPAKKYFSDISATLDVKLKVDIGEKKRIGHNVVGFIDNHAGATVILGAHFDHLGYGEDGNSMLRTGEKLIHNGADDNASGTAALIELARMLKVSKIKNTNFLFVAFSGEELGLYGSKYFADNSPVDLKSVYYMINMDMVGRLNDSTHALTVGGYGTSPEWAKVISTDKKKSPFAVKIDSSGTGPSDHTSFYRKDIPVLFLFTGLHSDYHRPSDDAEKINYTGEWQIVNYVNNIITLLSKQGQKPVFTKTRESQTGTSARFSVTMGIMPDYTFPGTGVRCDGVSDGRPAQKAGLKTGDIITQLGEHAVSSVETYMQALGKFKKGDKTVVKYKRGDETLESEVQF